MKRRQTILVVDDEPKVLGLFERILSKERYTLLTVNNGKEALELVRRKRPDLIILDLKMPDMNGIETLRRINRLSENTEVIIITGYGSMETVRAAMRLGVYDYITKPFDINYIKALVKDALSDASGSLVQKVRGDEEILKETSV
jgi:DNA-binding NtrC family response regulator